MYSQILVHVHKNLAGKIKESKNIINYVISKIRVFRKCFFFQSSQTQTAMDAFESARSFGGSEETQIPVPSEHNGGLHEAGRHHVRLHEEAVPGPHRPPLSRHSTQQEIWPCKLHFKQYFLPFGGYNGFCPVACCKKVFAIKTG